MLQSKKTLFAFSCIMAVMALLFMSRDLGLVALAGIFTVTCPFID